MGVSTEVRAEALGASDVDLTAVADVAAELLKGSLVQVGEGIDGALPDLKRGQVRQEVVTWLGLGLGLGLG